MSRTVTGFLPGTGRVAVTIEGASISTVEVVDTSPIDLSTDDADLLLPGLIDLQVNGYAGIDLNDDDLTPHRLLTLVDALAATGITAFCPTLITAPLDDVTARLSALAAAVAAEPRVAAAVLGVHLEGPWISGLDGARGAHPAEHVRPATSAELDALVAAGADIAIITLAPEQEGAVAMTRAAVDRGIVVAIGHSAASPDQAVAAIDAGATLATHLGNGIAARLPRHPNLLWTLLADDRVTASFIADGHHLDTTTLRAMTRCKGPSRTILVSDTTALGGLAPGRYTTPIGGVVELDAAGRLGMVDSPYLAGAARPLIDGLALLLRAAVVPPADAVAATTARPAALLGSRAAGRGVLEPGARADVVLARWSGGRGTIAITETISAGRSVVPSGSDA